MNAWFSRNFVNEKKKDQKETHLLLNGGKLYIPPRLYEEFLEEYSTAVSNPYTKLYIVEQKTDPFRFHIDIDYVDVEQMNIEVLKEFLFIVLKTLHDIYGFSPDAYVCYSPTKPSKDGVKSGYHIYYPDIVVFKATAISIRKLILNYITESYPIFDWNNIYDINTYKGSGLRLPWSLKKEETSQEFVYRPAFIYTSQNEIKELENRPSPELMKKLTIRCPDPNTEITNYNVNNLGDVTTNTTSHGDFNKSNIESEVTDSTLISMVQERIRNAWRGKTNNHWDNIEIKKIFKTCDETYIATTYNKFCMNVGRCHTNNHIYFVLSKKDNQIYQKCHSTNGSCANWRQKPSHLGEELHLKLFGGSIYGRKEKWITKW